MTCPKCGTVMLPIRHIDFFRGPSRVIFECQRDPAHIAVQEIDRGVPVPPRPRS